MSDSANTTERPVRRLGETANERQDTIRQLRQARETRAIVDSLKVDLDEMRALVAPTVASAYCPVYGEHHDHGDLVALSHAVDDLSRELAALRAELGLERAMDERGLSVQHRRLLRKLHQVSPCPAGTSVIDWLDTELKGQ